MTNVYVPHKNNLHFCDYDYIIEAIHERLGGRVRLEDEYVERLMDIAYTVYGRHFKDSHYEILKYKLKKPNAKSLNEIAAYYNTTTKKLEVRWRATVRKKFTRFVLAAIHFERKSILSELDYEDIVNICDLDKRCSDLLLEERVNSYKELVKFIKHHQLIYLGRISGTNIGETTIRRLAIAEATLRKYFESN